MVTAAASSSTTLVNVSDDAEVRLVSLLAEAAPPDLLGPSFQSDCQASIDAGEAGTLLAAVLSDPGATAALLALGADEALAAFTLLAALLERAGRPAGELATAVVQADAARAVVPDSDERKIALLSALYNMRSDETEKADILRSMLELAGRSGSSRTLLASGETLGGLLSCPGDEESALASASLPSSSSGRCLDASQPPIVALLDSWHVQDRKPIYGAVASALPDSDVRKQRFLLLLVASYSASESGSDQAIEVAAQAAVGAIRDPVSLFVLQRNLLAYPAVQALERKHRVLLGLLRVFQEGQLADYQAMLASNGGPDRVLAPWGLDGDACSRHMRILSLCTLASGRDEVPYSDVKEVLQLPSESDVESSVIDAVSTGLLRAKMDQLRQTVMVERSVVRRFDMDQWKALQSRLRSWKQSVGSVLSALKEGQTAAAAAATTAGAGSLKLPSK